jgi:alpha-beta hydrolase superfamily lysophospholipase
MSSQLVSSSLFSSEIEIARTKFFPHEDLYLIQPPPDATHKPIPPSKIVFAGDSAGGALCLTMLTVLRDLGRPLPAGAVLISPWVDLTHSFPSIHTNTATVSLNLTQDIPF